MRNHMRIRWAWLAVAGVASLLAASAAAAGETSLTIYNQGFGVVREPIALDLKEGANQVRYDRITSMLEPDSVILRDLSGTHDFKILEQSYRGDSISQGMLLWLNEGNTLDFLVQREDVWSVVSGKVIRSGYTPVEATRTASFASVWSQAPPVQPIVEVDGRQQFELPGTPLFPKLPDDSVLNPTLNWTISSEAAGPFDAELAYASWGLDWEASYSLIQSDTRDALDLIAWVTMTNTTGRDFESATVKLMAGGVSKLIRRSFEAHDLAMTYGAPMRQRSAVYFDSDFRAEPQVTQKTFDEYHLYSVARPITLHNNETKQIEFSRAVDVETSRFYVYNGSTDEVRSFSGGQPNADPGYGIQCNQAVVSALEFKNEEANHLGFPLPAGTVRLYRRDSDGGLQLTGKGELKHTAQDEKLTLATGVAFDLIGERKRTAFDVNWEAKRLTESFEIRLRSQKAAPVEVRVFERLYRGANWRIDTYSDPFLQKDSSSIEFRVQVKPGVKKLLTYTVAYTW
ncbi:MAG: hypothetical protein K1Y02_23555 [Candidatus Hydrogenedentes bacterium]|nr:hypothetical protein [Candidatus Hydrogenedentota bacterium]